MNLQSGQVVRLRNETKRRVILRPKEEELNGHGNIDDFPFRDAQDVSLTWKSNGAFCDDEAIHKFDVVAIISNHDEPEERIVEVEGPAPQVGQWYAGVGYCSGTVANVLQIYFSEGGKIVVHFCQYSLQSKKIMIHASAKLEHQEIDFSNPIPTPEWYKPIRLVKKAPPTDAEIVAQAMGWKVMDDTKESPYIFFVNDQNEEDSLTRESVAKLAAVLKKGGA